MNLKESHLHPLKNCIVFVYLCNWHLEKPQHFEGGLQTEAEQQFGVGLREFRGFKIWRDGKKKSNSSKAPPISKELLFRGVTQDSKGCKLGWHDRTELESIKIERRSIY